MLNQIQTMSRGEFAEHRGVHRSRVTQWSGQGLITWASPGRIDVAATDAKLPPRRAPNMPKDAPDPVADPRTERDNARFLRARADREVAEAARAEFLTRKLGGELVEVAAISKLLGTASAQIRHGLERIPDRLSALLAAESDADRIHQMLQAALDEVLDELSRLRVGGAKV